MLASKIKQDLNAFDSKAKQLKEEARKVQLQRTKCNNASTWPCLTDRNFKPLPANLIPSQDQTVSALVNRPDNDPFNKPTIIRLVLIPETIIDPKMELQYRYAIDNEGVLEYNARILTVNRKEFPLPTKQNDFRFGILQDHMDKWKESVATHTKADKKTFTHIQYKWETTKPLFEGCIWNQFQKDFILHRYSAKEIQAIRSYK